MARKLTIANAKPSDDSHAARRPVQPSVRRATNAHEYTAQVSRATKIFGSSSDIALMFGSFGSTPRAWAVQTTPTITPSVRKIQPTVTAREFITSRICSDRADD